MGELVNRGTGEGAKRRMSESENGRKAESLRRPVTPSPFRRKGERINSHRELHVYQNAINAAMKIFELTKLFPSEEKFSMTDQMRRSSRSVCANLAEAWRKRRYQNAFIAKLSDAESEACETQVWLEFAQRCGYLNQKQVKELDDAFDHIIGQIVKMIQEADKWIIK
jgi:four helix bundle protein